MRRPPLWAPWRMEYLESEKSGVCIFCEPPSACADRERLILHRSRHVFIMLNRYPYAVGHLMVAPYAHCAQFEELEPEAHSDLIGRIADGARILESAFRCNGLNIGANIGTAAGAGFPEHLHFHVVPRWRDDTNFMAVIGETRVIPKHLDSVFEELVPKFQELPAS